jgi:hypothetical protein
MDILLIQFCTVALENLQDSIFIKIAEQFDVLTGMLFFVGLIWAVCVGRIACSVIS